jgi:predicted nuclease of restriction endonuclease-like (RecB) superfamily
VIDFFLQSFTLQNHFNTVGRDFTFIGDEYRIQVGKNDYFIDLLFFHRGFRCLVMFELKIDDFKPEYIGKLNFYLEALDRFFICKLII